MEQLPLSFKQLLEMVFYFSSLILLLGIIFQFLFIFNRDKKLSVKLFLIIALTQLLVFMATILIWVKWPMGLRILYGPILFPALIAEISIIPIVFSFFNFIQIWNNFFKNPTHMIRRIVKHIL